jgi:hypothetical protein
MPARIRLVALAAAAALTSGCITALTNIKVRPDGSGTIEQTLSMTAEAAKQVAALASGFGDPSEKKKPEADDGLPDFFSEQSMKEAAAKLGEGVVFVSSTPIRTPERVGRVATYQFADITKVRIDQKPQTGDAMPGPDAKPGAEDVLFRFAKQPAGTSKLTVLFPEPEFGKKKDGEGDDETDEKKAPDPQQLEMMKKIFDGLRVSIDVTVLGSIVKTNSPYVQGSTVTLLEMDFAQLLANDALLSKMDQPKSLEEAKAMLKDVKGFKINLDREVGIEFK